MTGRVEGLTVEEPSEGNSQCLRTFARVVGEAAILWEN